MSSLSSSYSYKGQNLTISEIVEFPECQVKNSVLFNRINILNWPVELAVTTPKGKSLQWAIEANKNAKLISDQQIISEERRKSIFRKPVHPMKTGFWYHLNKGIFSNGN